MKPLQTTIFLDTSALITLVNEARPHHAAMVAFLRRLDQRRLYRQGRLLVHRSGRI